MQKNKKRGLSPVVSTALLILLVIIIAIIILLWYRSFIKEKILKFDESIDSVCRKVDLETFVNDDQTFGIKNNGNVPVYGFNIFLTGNDGTISDLRFVDSDARINIGGSIQILRPEIDSYDKYKSIKISPILIGNVKSGETKEYDCPEDISSFVV
ncbi:MAG: archaellin/type IV pilin N-terminal domain-containing protein [Candidatus Nanoarchaeia archaeon]